MLRKDEVKAKVKRLGFTPAQIDAERDRQRRSTPTIRRNQIRALNLHAHHNAPEDWLRLLGAMLA